MPIYSYRCLKCGKTRDEFKELKDYKEPVVCECGEVMGKLIPNTKVNMRGIRGITSRTDVEIDVISQEDSIKELANG